MQMVGTDTQKAPVGRGLKALKFGGANPIKLTCSTEHAKKITLDVFAVYHYDQKDYLLSLKILATYR